MYEHVCLKGKQRDLAIHVSSRQTVKEKGAEVLRGQSSAYPSIREKDRISHPEHKKKGPKEPEIIRKRKKRAERQKKIHRQRPESYQRKISARDKASRQGVVFRLFEASCHHH